MSIALVFLLAVPPARNAAIETVSYGSYQLCAYKKLQEAKKEALDVDTLAAHHQKTIIISEENAEKVMADLSNLSSFRCGFYSRSREYISVFVVREF